MSIINYQSDRKILVFTKGHPYSLDDLKLAFAGLENIDTCFVEQPAAQHLFKTEVAAEYDAYVFYDMPGLDFLSAEPPSYIEPSESFKRDFLALLQSGKGMVFLHHAIAAWPAWDEYAEIVGGRFFYKPDQLRGKKVADSGYRHDVQHTIKVLEQHPLTSGIGDSFTITDELYLSQVFTDSIHPLLQSDYRFEDENFYSSYLAVQGNMFSREGWSHPKGDPVIGWYKHYANSPLVYLQCGDGKSAYENSSFQRLLSNAIDWVRSDSAQEWAKQQG